MRGRAVAPVGVALVGVALVGLALVGLALAARRALDVVEVRGGSMSPTLEPGDRLLVVRTAGRPGVGQVVLAPDPREPRRELVKRVVGTTPAGVLVAGDAPLTSTDHRAFGAIRPSEIRWRVVVRYWPPDRAGRIPAGPVARAADIRVGRAALTAGKS